MDDAQANSLARWALKESRLLKPTSSPGSPLERDLLATWKVNRPKMLAALRARKAEKALAHVLVDRFLKAEAKYLSAGMPPPDAREQAEQEWLLREPETEQNRPPLLVQIIPSGTQAA